MGESINRSSLLLLQLVHPIPLWESDTVSEVQAALLGRERRSPAPDHDGRPRTHHVTATSITQH